MFTPTGRCKFVSGRSFGIEELYDYISREPNPHVVAGYVSSVYNFDMPWCYHLERVLKPLVKQFTNQAYMKQVIEWYIGVINQAETYVYNETKETIDLCFHTNGSHHSLASSEHSS